MQSLIQRLGLTLALIIVAVPALAQDAAIQGMARDWQTGMQDAGSPVMSQLHTLNAILTPIVVGISLFVFGLLAYVCYRFTEKRQASPSKRTHNTVLEIVWTGVPVLILVIIAIPSFRTLYFMDQAENPELTIKAIGFQWAWAYEYPDYENFGFEAYLVDDADLEPGQPRLLQTDYEVVVPAQTDIRLLTTARDVLHSFAMPSLGVKMDAVPGRLNETWFRVEQPGYYYGQCSEICGVNHGYMPITIRAVPKAEFEEWATTAQQEFAESGDIAPAYAVLDRPAPMVAMTAPATDETNE